MKEVIVLSREFRSQTNSLQNSDSKRVQERRAFERVLTSESKNSQNSLDSLNFSDHTPNKNVQNVRLYSSEKNTVSQESCEMNLESMSHQNFEEQKRSLAGIQECEGEEGGSSMPRKRIDYADSDRLGL